MPTLPRQTRPSASSPSPGTPGQGRGEGLAPRPLPRSQRPPIRSCHGRLAHVFPKQAHFPATCPTPQPRGVGVSPSRSCTHEHPTKSDPNKSGAFFSSSPFATFSSSPLRLLLPLILLLSSTAPSFGTPIPNVTFSCSPTNDLYTALKDHDQTCPRYDSPLAAADHAPDNSSLLILSDTYPTTPTPLGDAFWSKAQSKHLRLYIEYPADVPGLALGAPHPTAWERQVITTDTFGPTLPNLHILQQHDCHFLPTTPTLSDHPWLTIARVAGYDTAIYGLPKQTFPALLSTHDDQWLIATTKLSAFITGRYAPTQDWATLWQTILTHVAPNHDWKVEWTPLVHPAYGKSDPLPPDAERQAFTHYATWLRNSHLLIPESKKADWYARLAKGEELIEAPAKDEPLGDGSAGMLEGYASQISFDGTQRRRLPIRADCNAEQAMTLALDYSLRHDPDSKRIATNLLRFVYVTSGLCAGDRADPRSPAFGLIAWGDLAPAWLVANYGDDNARALLATLTAAAALDNTPDYDPHLLRGLLANLRTTGTLGFRGDRIDMPALTQQGWKPFHDAKTVNYAPHFESYLWACYLWAYAHTNEPEFLSKTKTAIRMTMDAYPDKWRWGDNIERARMLLCLSWLVRVEDTPEHRAWLTRIATDLLANQDPETGAIQERRGNPNGGHYQIPQSNEAYGTGETPLIQSNGDPASDQLYTTGFALLGLHEAVGATNDPKLKQAEDHLAQYLCRIQSKSQVFSWENGVWMRAFDYKKWDFWSSSADFGWGAWSVESGWAQSWTAATLAFRSKNTTLWDLTARSQIRTALPQVQKEMALNDGRPKASPPTP